MKEIVVTRNASSDEFLDGRKLTDEDVDVRVQNEAARVVTEDGRLLAVLCPGGVKQEIEGARATLVKIKGFPTNRATAVQGHSERGINSDGTRSKTVSIRRAGAELYGINSQIIGFFDRTVRFPYCRRTSYNINHAAKWAGLQPLILGVDAVFREQAAERYARQAAAMARVPDDFKIPGTVFTTITVNQNWQTAVHKDAGDYRPGFGVLACARSGKYSGGLFVLPGFSPRVGIDMQDGDVLLADVHEWHGNTPIRGVPGRFTRVTCVFYMRVKMVLCGSAEAELHFAQNRPTGTSVATMDAAIKALDGVATAEEL